jgi:hypothetical protein
MDTHHVALMLFLEQNKKALCRGLIGIASRIFFSPFHILSKKRFSVGGEMAEEGRNERKGLTGYLERRTCIFVSWKADCSSVFRIVEG